MSGTFRPTYVSDSSKLQEMTPIGVTYMPSTYYLSDESSQQLAQLLGGKVVQKQPFPVSAGWQEPKANFIQLPSGQTVNAADLAYYARCSSSTPQLYANLTAEINQGGAVTQYYDSVQATLSGQGFTVLPHPDFQPFEVGQAIAGMTYPPGMVNSDGTVINPAAPNSKT